MIRAASLVVAWLVAAPLFGDWATVAGGVQYQRFSTNKQDIHVVRIDLANPEIRVVGTLERDRGLTVTEFARRNKAIAAINADYFSSEMRPVGLTIGPCGVWDGSRDTEREGVVAFGDGRADIYPQKETLDVPAEWMRGAVSGWPMIVKDCEALTAAALPGSDGFTRTPHPRTAVGISADGKTMYFVVADGRRDGIPGLTLARLAAFMHDELGVCEAMNLDGGGSSAMWVRDALVNQPADRFERRVANHLAIVRASDLPSCESNGRSVVVTLHTESGTPNAPGRKPDVKPQQ